MSWEGEEFWVHIIKNHLYPPEAITKRDGMKILMAEEDFPGKRVLDHGCGTGIFGSMASECGAQVIGIDASWRILQEARVHIPVVCADINAMPFPNHLFDIVLSSMVLQIFQNIDVPINEIARVLKGSGRLIVSIVCPSTEKWNHETGRLEEDKEGYSHTEQRAWIFHLTDGSSVSASYIHRPIEAWIDAFSRLFSIESMIELEPPEALLRTGRYAKREYLFLSLKKI